MRVHVCISIHHIWGIPGHPTFPREASSQDDMEYYKLTRKDAVPMPHSARVMEVAVAMTVATRTNTTKSMAKGTTIRLAVQISVSQFHATHPNSLSAFITINTPPQCGFMESYVRIAVTMARAINIRKQDIGHWELCYIAGGVEVHPGKHHTNDRTYAAQALLMRRRQLKEMKKDLKLMFLKVSI